MATQSKPEPTSEERLLTEYITEINDLAEEVGTLRSVMQHISLTAQRTDISRRMRLTLIISTAERNYGGYRQKT